MLNCKPKALNSKQTQKPKLKTQNKYFDFLTRVYLGVRTLGLEV
jgi:hypothetical protein